MLDFVNMQAKLDAVVGEHVRISRETNHGIWLWLKRSGDPDDRVDWPKQHAWLAQRMAKFATVYRELIAPTMHIGVRAEEQSDQGADKSSSDA